MSPVFTRSATRRALAAGLVALVIGAAGPARAVVGGLEAGGALARSAVMVLSSRGGVCSGVVVAPDVVLTAAHCATNASEYRVHYREGGEPVLIAPTAGAVHPGYDRGALKGRRRSVDLALLRLPEPLPTRFAPATLSETAPAKGAGLTLGGYGVLRPGDARSTGTFREAKLAVVEPFGRATILVWASDPTHGGAGACEGDSGGPIAEGDAVAAITTWAAGARQGCGDMSQGVLVGPQRRWIDGVLAGWGRDAGWR